MPETSAPAGQSVDDAGEGPVRRGWITRRRAIWGLVIGIVAAAVAVLLAGRAWLDGFRPLAAGQLDATSSTDAWEVDSFLFDNRALLVRNEYGATVTLHQEIHNVGSRGIEILDPGPALADWRESNAPCAWQPVRARFFVMDGEVATRALEVPFDLEPGKSFMLELTGRIGEPGCDGPKSAYVGSEINIPLRFGVLGISRTQSVPLDLMIWETDEPERGLNLSVRKLEAD
ncbi:hypothetical protein H9Y04_18390 [Streptomyces sp. TRM66268-LWL]|uniref:Uncharacterized protein n=1 Tax=Streptomyces polyasparticus TaxID=2767826 RepID=A0ABR7SH23_9ACTN|nr:hypothetical protein [Streptomyces polyasparticus]MBC9714529.1 hypothetical protein [Streptomyces polyasparticus]